MAIRSVRKVRVSRLKRLNSRHLKLQTSQHDLWRSCYLLPNNYHGLIKPRRAKSPLTPDGIAALFWTSRSSTHLSETKRQCQPWLTAQLICHVLIWSRSHRGVISQAQIFPKNTPRSQILLAFSSTLQTYAIFFTLRASINNKCKMLVLARPTNVMRWRH